MYVYIYTDVLNNTLFLSIFITWRHVSALSMGHHQDITYEHEYVHELSALKFEIFPLSHSRRRQVMNDRKGVCHV